MHAVLTSLHAFLSAATRPRTPLARGIIAVLCIKLVVADILLMRKTIRLGPVAALNLKPALGTPVAQPAE